MSSAARRGQRIMSQRRKERPIKGIEGASSEGNGWLPWLRGKTVCFVSNSLVPKKVRNLERRAEVESTLGSLTRPILAAQAPVGIPPAPYPCL